MWAIILYVNQQHQRDSRSGFFPNSITGGWAQQPCVVYGRLTRVVAGTQGPPTDRHESFFRQKTRTIFSFAYPAPTLLPPSNGLDPSQYTGAFHQNSQSAIIIIIFALIDFQQHKKFIFFCLYPILVM
jgi:hypothetical protein